MTDNGGFTIKRPASGDVALQITSMADIFTIILVFLLKSYATGSLNVRPSPGMVLPKANAAEANVEALTVEISQNTVQVENSPVSTLMGFRFPISDLKEGGLPKSLDNAFANQKKRQELIAKTNSDVQVDRKMLVVADERVPYITLKSVLSVAAVNGFTEFKLVVVKNQ